MSATAATKDAKDAKDAKDDINCNVCFNTLRNPHKLTCKHSLCLDCIKAITKGDKVQCPDCKAFSDVKAVKPDYKSQRLVETYKETQIVSVEELQKKIQGTKVKQCEVCNENEMKISAKCKECNLLMCVSCEKAHRGFKEFKEHKMINIDDFLKKIQSNLTATISYVQTEKAQVAKNYPKLDKMISEINTGRDQQLTDIDKYKDLLKQEIDKYCLEMKKLINDANDNSIDNCLLKKQAFYDIEKEIQLQITLLQEMIDKKDLSVLTQSADQVEATIRENMKQAKARMPKIDQNLKAIISVTKGERWDQISGPRVVVDRNKLQSTSTSNINLRRGSVVANFGPGPTGPPAAGADAVKGDGVYSHLQRNTYRQVKNVDLTERAWRMCKINDGIWAVDNSNLYKYSKDGKCLHTVKLQNDIATGITNSHTGHVIIAQDYHGLQQYDTDAKYIGEILPGNFSDIFAHEEQLFALAWKPTPTVIVFKHADDKWVKDKEIELNYSDCHSFDKLWIHKDKMYISSYNNNCLYVYNMDGEFQIEAGEHGSGNPGNLRLPWICGVDTQGTVLVADRGNHRLQLYNTTRREWTELEIDDTLKEPMQAIVDENAENVWIITGYPYKIIKYSKN